MATLREEAEELQRALHELALALLKVFEPLLRWIARTRKED